MNDNRFTSGYCNYTGYGNEFCTDDGFFDCTGYCDISYDNNDYADFSGYGYTNFSGYGFGTGLGRGKYA